MDTDPRSVARLFANALDEFVQLLLSEVAVAQAEFSEKLSQATSGAVMLLVALLLLMPVSVVLLLAFATWLTELGLRASLAQLLASLAGLAVVGSLAVVGKMKLDPARLVPKRTLREIQRSSNMMRKVQPR